MTPNNHRCIRTYCRQITPYHSYEAPYYRNIACYFTQHINIHSVHELRFNKIPFSFYTSQPDDWLFLPTHLIHFFSLNLSNSIPKLWGSAHLSSWPIRAVLKSISLSNSILREPIMTWGLWARGQTLTNQPIACFTGLPLTGRLVFKIQTLAAVAI